MRESKIILRDAKCLVCGTRPRTIYKIQIFSGTWGYLCHQHWKHMNKQGGTRHHNIISEDESHVS